MPTYEYECKKCGKPFDAFQRMSDPPLGQCPHCGSKRVQRLISGGGGIIFKGSGFYETDYKRGKDYKEAAKNDRETPKTEEKKSPEPATPKKEKASSAAV